MFLKGDLPSVPVRGAHEWREMHKKKRDRMKLMKKLFIEAGTKKEAEHSRAIRRARERHRGGETFIVPSTPPSGAKKTSLPPASRTKFHEDDGKHGNKVSGSSCARGLCTAVKQLQRGLERCKGLRALSQVEDIFDELEGKHPHLLSKISKVQALVKVIIKEGRIQPETSKQLSIRKSESRFLKTLTMKPDKKRPTSAGYAFFARCAGLLSPTEKDMIWLLLKRAGMFQQGTLDPVDPVIVCSMLIRLLYEETPSLKLPTLAAAVTSSKNRAIESERGNETKRPATIPQINNKKGNQRKNQRGMKDLFSKWEGMVQGGGPRPKERKKKEGKRRRRKNSVKGKARGASLPRIGKKKSILEKAVNGPLSKTLLKKKKNRKRLA